MDITNEEKVDVINKGVSLKKIKFWKSKIINRLTIEFKKNKMLLATLSAFIIFSLVNAMMICTFFKIVTQI